MGHDIFYIRRYRIRLEHFIRKRIDYFPPALSILLQYLQHFTVSSKPANHARIGNEEKEYLHQEIGELVKTRKHSDVPWSSLLTSKPVWALIIAQLGHDWALFFQSSYTPTILTEQLKMTVKEAGRYGALGYFVAWVFSIFCGYLGGYLIRRRQITITNSRKLFTVLCNNFNLLTVHHT